MARRDRCSIRTPLLIQRSGQPFQAGVTLDLGRGGIGFVSPAAAEPGESLDLELVVRDGSLRMVVEVVWSTPLPQGHRCGARLRTIGVRDALLLKQQLADARSGGLRAAS